MIDIDFLFPNGLSVDDAIELIRPMALYVLAMAFYSVFVFNFYRFVAKRDMFALDFTRFEESRHRSMRKFWHWLTYAAKYLIVFPLFAFFWFGVLTAMLTFLSTGRETPEVLLIAMATVSAIRFCAYYNEDLARDLAKIFPFALLALFLIDSGFFDIWESIEKLERADQHRETILYYLLFLIGLELVLRLAFGSKGWLFRKQPVRVPSDVQRKNEDVEVSDASPSAEEHAEASDEAEVSDESGDGTEDAEGSDEAPQREHD